MPNNWIDSVMAECEHVETPRAWLAWSLCCSISAAMGNNYYMRVLKGAVEVRANIYVILLGESGLGKEFPVKLALELTEKADVTRVISGRSSIQAIVKEVSTARTRRDGKAPFVDSRAFIANGEMSTAIIQDPDSLTILTDLYDRKANWTNLLKGDGAEKLKEPYFTCLFGSSPAHFYESVPQVNMEGGYIGRNFIIQEEKRYKDTDLFEGEDSTDDFPFLKFISHLENISKGGGRIIPNADAKQLFNDWRRSWRGKNLTDKTGFANRVPVHVLKLAMILCCAEYEPSLVVTERHIEQAIDMVVPLTYSSKKAAEGKGTDPLAAQTKMILDFLLLAPQNVLFRKQLLTKGYGNFDTVVCDKIIDNLKEIGWVRTEIFRAGVKSDVIIHLEGEPLEQYRKFMAERGRKSG